MKDFRLVKYILLVWILLVGTTLLHSQQKSIPNGYYNGTETLSGAALKTALYNIIKGHTDLGYDGLYNAYKTTDNLVIAGTSYVYDMYSIKADSSANYYYSHVTADHCGNYSNEGDCYNREHSFPQSWFGTGTPKSDAFQVYPTDGYVNGKRGNYPYGEVTSPSWTSSNGSKVGSCSYSGYTGTVFEPIDEYKGDFARTYFYMATRYENVIAGWPGSPMTNSTSYPCFTAWALNMLIEWNNQDPISEKEITRNEAVYLLQHNRNPFIDHPEFVAQIWGGNSPSIISNINTQPAIPLATDEVTVLATITDADGISAVILKWGTNSASLINSINMASSGDNLYSSQTNIPAQSAGITVYYKIEVTDLDDVITTSTTHSYTIATNSPSLISNITIQPIVPTTTDVVKVTATITDAEGISAVILKWGTNSASLINSINMASSGDNLYSSQTNIPAQSAGITVYYKIEVTDGDAFITTSTINSYTIGSSDIIAPILSVSPPDGATQVPITSHIIINSNEPLKNTYGDTLDIAYIKNVILVTNNLGSISYSVIISTDQKQITLTPGIGLNYQTIYTVAISNQAFADASGNETIKYAFLFTTEAEPDTQAPLLTITPPKNATDVELNSTIKISSDEPLLTAAGQPIDPTYLKSVIALKLSDENGTSLAFSVGISNGSQLIMVSPSVPFTNETTYFAKVNPLAFSDSAGNLTDSIQTSFTTKPEIDTKAPAFVAGFPKIEGIASNSFGLVVSIDEPGKVYYQLKLKTETAPTIQQLIESTFIDITEGYEPDTITFEGLTEYTAYSVYLLTQDKQPTPNTSSFALKQNVTTLGIAPTVTIGPANQLICKGNEVFFLTKASGTEPLFYQWYFGEIQVQGATIDTLIILSALDNHAGLYSCKISNAWGFAFTNEAELSFIPDVFAGTDNQKTVKDTVSSLNLASLLLDNPTPNGIWVDLDNSGALNGTMFNPSMAGTGNYQFSYKVANQCMEDSSIIKVIVEGIPPNVISQPSNYITCVDGEAIFVVKAEGTAPFNYEWNFNDSPIASSDNDTLFLKQVNQGFSGNYTCTVSSEWGISYSEPAVLNFYEPVSAGTDNQTSVNNTVLEINLFDLLLNRPTPGGDWTDLDQTGALVGSMFNPNQAGAGVYHFEYVVTNPCMIDTSTVTVSVEWPDAIDESFLRELVLYPNPSKGIITVKISFKVHEFSAQVFNPDGKLLKQFENINPSSNPILDLSELGKGIYFIKMSIDSSVLVRKVVIE